MLSAAPHLSASAATPVARDSVPSRVLNAVALAVRGGFSHSSHQSISEMACSPIAARYVQRLMSQRILRLAQS